MISLGSRLRGSDESGFFRGALRRHALSGRLLGLHSISINLAQRITLELLIQDAEIILVNVGSHEEVYQ